MSVIKIGIACHKPSELPKSDLYLPIRVGASLSMHDYGLQRDDDGDNISSKNKEYCELTAQYWMWKNLKADYYGLCHYRRYINFSDLKVKKNYRNQIIAPILDDESKLLYGLEDDILIRKQIEAYDLITGELQDVSKLYTPRGSKKTAYQHWIAHDRDLIMKKDLDKMLDILDEMYPEIGPSTREYLNGPYFLGFNCFVANKSIFNELCEIEFNVLRELEKYIDFSRYSVRLSRIYGFMGEILSSAFFYYIEKSGKYKVKHLPLVYFENTDPIEDIIPIDNTEKFDVVPILFNISDGPLYKFGTIWRSFLDNLNENYYYDVILTVNRPEKELLQLFKQMSNDYTNISLRIFDLTYYRIKYGEKLKIDYDKKNSSDNEEYVFSLIPLLPFILSKYDKMIVINQNNIFCDSIIDLWNKHKYDTTIISAPINFYIHSLVNDIFYQTKEEGLSAILKNPLNYFSTNIFLLNFSRFREAYSESEVYDSYIIKDTLGQCRTQEEIMNSLCEENVSFLDMRWATWLDSDEITSYQFSYAQADLFHQMTDARKNPGVITYLTKDLYNGEFSELYFVFWNVAQKIPLLYPTYIKNYSLRIANNNVSEAPLKWRIVDKLAVSKLLPKNSMQRKLAQRIFHIINDK